MLSIIEDHYQNVSSCVKFNEYSHFALSHLDHVSSYGLVKCIFYNNTVTDFRNRITTSIAIAIQHQPNIIPKVKT